MRLGLSKPLPALENAEDAVRFDPTYAKGHYRKGQSLMALSRPAEAAEAFRMGATLEPESKLWGPLIQKAVKAAAEKGPATKSQCSNAVSSKTTVSRRGSSTTTPAAAVKPPPSPTASTTKASGDEHAANDASKSPGAPVSGMKGYKKTADGHVTTYFNNTLTEEAKMLIGDIAPKKIDLTAAAGSGNGAAGNDVSVWNKAGTWESRDMTRWGS